MFVQVSARVPLSLEKARAALDRALRDGGLVAESRRAHDEGMSFLMRVGPHPSSLAGKQVRVQVLPSRDVGGLVTVPLRWEATGPTGRLFPTLDADLTLRAEGDGTRVAIVGAYQPPLGRLGPALDRTVLSGVATDTLNALLHEVTGQIVRHTSEPAAAAS